MNSFEYIRDNWTETQELLAAARKERAALPEARQKPTVYLATVSQPVPNRADRNPAKKISITQFHVQGGHCKPGAMMNKIRRGKYPVGYDFPTDKQLKGMLDSVRTTDATISGIWSAVAVSDGDPFGELRGYLNGHIKLFEAVIGNPEAAKERDELQARLEETERRLLEEKMQRQTQDVEFEKLKAEISTTAKLEKASHKTQAKLNESKTKEAPEEAA